MTSCCLSMRSGPGSHSRTAEGRNCPTACSSWRLPVHIQIHVFTNANVNAA